MAPPAASRHGAIVRYSVSYQAVSGEDTERHEVKDIGADALSYVLEGLEKWTEYQVCVRAHTDVGPGPESPAVRTRTKEDGRSEKYAPKSRHQLDSPQSSPSSFVSSNLLVFSTFCCV